VGILVLLVAATGTVGAYRCCAEWVNEYHGYLPSLEHNDENAEGFYNELSSDAYWSGDFIYGDDWA